MALIEQHLSGITALNAKPTLKGTEMIRLLSLICVIGLLFGAPAHASFSGDFFFLGDSQTDSGNNALLTTSRSEPPYDPVPFFPYATSGNYSNGRVWAQYLADAFQKQATPSVATGTNYAFGGARIVDGPFPSLDLDAQVAYLLGDYSGNLPSDGLYILWGGSNDTGDAIQASDQSIIDSALANYEGIMRGLAAAGAEHFLVLNVPDLGLFPPFNPNPAASLVASNFSASFNQGLLDVLNTLTAELTGVEFELFDVFGFTRELASDPTAFGLANVADSCISPGVDDLTAECDVPDEYLFWDFVHFTTAGHASLAREIASQIPLPGTLVLIAMGLILTTGFRKNRRLACIGQLTSAN